MGISGTPQATGTNTALAGRAVQKMAAGDYFQAQVYHFTGAALNIETSSAWSPEFSVTWIGTG